MCIHSNEIDQKRGHRSPCIFRRHDAYSWVRDNMMKHSLNRYAVGAMVGCIYKFRLQMPKRVFPWELKDKELTSVWKICLDGGGNYEKIFTENVDYGTCHGHLVQKELGGFPHDKDDQVEEEEGEKEEEEEEEREDEEEDQHVVCLPCKQGTYVLHEHEDLSHCLNNVEKI